jgi:hypothetical protein
MLAWNLASTLLGVAACLYLPLTPWISERAATVVAASLSFVPWLLGRVWKNLPADGTSLREPAAFVDKGGLFCVSEAWAAQLGERLGAQCRSVRRTVKSHAGLAFAGVVIALVATPWLYDYFHPYVRMLNLTEDALVVAVDDHIVAKVQPTSGENPLAGSIARVPAGKRVFVARHLDGATVEDLKTDVLAGRLHLFAPGRPEGTCFWLERTAGGRTGRDEVIRKVLTQTASFWTLDTEIDAWFQPALGSNKSQLTGGFVTALRQGTCPTSGDIEGD